MIPEILELDSYILRAKQIAIRYLHSRPIDRLAVASAMRRVSEQISSISKWLESVDTASNGRTIGPREVQDGTLHRNEWLLPKTR